MSWTGMVSFTLPTALPQRKESKIPNLQGAVKPILSVDIVVKTKTPFLVIKAPDMIIKPPLPLLTQLSYLAIQQVDLRCIKLLYKNTSLFMKCSGLRASMREPLLVFSNMCELTSYFKHKKFSPTEKSKNMLTYPTTLSSL
jgi:hypothetical protein